MPDHLTVPGLTVPDSPLARAAGAFAAATAEPWVVAHSRRTYHFGTALLERAGRPADPELLYVASMLHDVALGTALDDGRTPFEVLSARAARDLVLARGGSPSGAALVHDAIELHLELATGDHPRPEVAGVHLGSGLDVLGLRLGDVDPGLVDEVVATFPRDGLLAGFERLLAAEVAAKPGSRMAALVTGSRLLELMSPTLGRRP